MIEAEIKKSEDFENFRREYEEYRRDRTPEARLRLIKEIDEAIAELDTVLLVKKEQKLRLINGKPAEVPSEISEDSAGILLADMIGDNFVSQPCLPILDLASIGMFINAIINSSILSVVSGVILASISLMLSFNINPIKVLKKFFHWRLVKQTNAYHNLSYDIKQIRYTISMLRKMRLKLYIS